MPVDTAIRVWRADALPRVVFMHGVTDAHAMRPHGEYVVGLIGRSAVRISQGRARHVLRPGDLGVLDPAQPHQGAPADGSAWECRLMIVELPDLHEFAGFPLWDAEFPQPRFDDPVLARRFLALHRLSERCTWALDGQVGLTELCGDLVRRSPAARPERRLLRNDPVLRKACEYLVDNLAANVTLDELAAATGVGRYRLVRLFRAGIGVPPHRFQLAYRIRLARGLLERGVSAGAVAASAGFFDQSHLHRHFVAATGLTPGAYAAALRRQNVQDR